MLFGLFVDCFEGFIKTKLGDTVGVHLADVILQVLLYADDLVLLGESPEQLQLLLDCLSDFCKTYEMAVNVAKSDVVIFNRKHAPAILPDWIYNGESLPVKPEFKYLGIKFSNDGKCGGVSQAFDQQQQAARRALFAMWQQCY